MLFAVFASAAWAQTADEQVATGIEAFHHGQYSRALAVLARFPNDPRARLFSALSKAASGSCPDAEAELTRQFGSNPDPRLRRLSGLALVECRLARNEFDPIYPLLSRLERDFPKDADVLYEAAKVHRKAWDDTIVNLYRNAPASFRVNQLSAEVFEVENRYPEAIEEYRKAIAKNPQAVGLHYRLGRALLLASHGPSGLEAARNEFDAELGLNPDDAAAEYEIGQVLVAEQKSAEAARHFERAARLNAVFPEALVALARLRLNEKRFDDAIALLRRAVALRPKMESAHYDLMLAYRNAGRLDDARREKVALDQLQRPPDGEFTDFLKRLGEKAPRQP